MKRFIKLKRRIKNREKGVALFIALVALLLLAAIASGMMFMANTESAINYNYRDSQYTYFAASAGLEDAREMMRTDNKYLPLNSPSSSNAQGIIYILNPNAGETVDPSDPKNPYFDDELCHEFSKQLKISDPGTNIPCSEGPPAGSFTPYYSTVKVSGMNLPASGSMQGSKAALAYKWVRINLKYNATLVPVATTTSYGYRVEQDPSVADDALVCWENQSGHEWIINTENNLPRGLTPRSYPSEFELAALQQAIDAGLGSPAVFMFGGKGKGTNTSGTSTGSTTSSTSGSTTSGTTTGSTTTSGTTTGSTTTSGSTTGTSTTGTSTSGTASGTATGTGTASGTATGTGTASGTATGTGTGSGTATGTASGTTTGSGGYYKAVDDCNKTNKNRFSVYLVTSMAAGKNGTKRMAQYEISRELFPGVPGGLTFNGPGATYAPPSSANFTIDGTDHATAGGKCPGKGDPIHAVTAFGDPTDISKTIGTKDPTCDPSDKKFDPSVCSVSGLGTLRTKQDPAYPNDPTKTLPDPLAPDVVDGTAYDPQSKVVPLDGLTTVKENIDLVHSLANSADLSFNKPGVTATNDNLLPANSACAQWPFGTNDPKAPADCQGPKITAINGPADFNNANGVGILVVTGDLTLSGKLGWDGLILVIGTGKVTMKGGGSLTLNGGLYVANTNDPSGNLGNVSVDVNGGGNSSILYDSCKIADAVGNQSFRVISYREMTY